jgi:hypothetical protein
MATELTFPFGECPLLAPKRTSTHIQLASSPDTAANRPVHYLKYGQARASGASPWGRQPPT